MMKYLVITLLGCLYAAQAQAGSVMEAEGHLTEFRPRTGHFRLEPFMELFEYYASAFIKPQFPDLPADHHSFYTPTGVSCMNFFDRFKIDSYKLRDLDEVVLLDGCLGYLFESEYHEQDKSESSYVSENLDYWVNDDQLKSLYRKTKIDDFSQDAKDCVGDLLLGAIRVKKQFPELTCNNHWLELFLEFAECQKKTIPAAAKTSDSYLNTIYQLVKMRGKECFDEEIGHVNRATRAKYANSPFTSLQSLFGSSVRKQALYRYWPKSIKEILEAITQPKSELNLRDVNKIIRGVSQGQENYKNRFLVNTATYANKKLAKTLKGPLSEDQARGDYKKLIDGLCSPWRRSDNPNYYDYVTPFERMVKMLEYPEIFEITEKNFQDKVTNLAYESSPVFFSVSACNLLTFTHGILQVPVHNGPKRVVVKFAPDTTKMVVWPDAGFF